MNVLEIPAATLKSKSLIELAHGRAKLVCGGKVSCKNPSSVFPRPLDVTIKIYAHWISASDASLAFVRRTGGQFRVEL